MVISIIGLGLIGGSIARRLRGFHDCVIYGMDIDSETLTLAKADGVIDRAFSDGDSAVSDADIIILCLYPQLNVDFIKQHAAGFKQGALITDVSGVKGYVTAGIKDYLPKGVEFIGGHPMAGREVGGYKSSTDTLFDGASYLIMPSRDSSAEKISLIREMAEYIGCRHVITTTPEEHDAMIAYTSQLMHVVAVALCDNPLIERAAYFSAGSLRDCTRVALINADMWSELFLENKEALCTQIMQMQSSLEKMRKAIEENDRDGLIEILTRAKNQKQKWLTETVK